MLRRARLANLSRHIQHGLENFRLQLSSSDAILPLSILGLIAGTLAALTIIAFRLLVDYLQVALLPIDVAEDFEAMSTAWRVGSAVIGGLLIGLLFRLAPEPLLSVDGG